MRPLSIRFWLLAFAVGARRDVIRKRKALRREALAVEHAVVGVVYEELRGARVRPARREAHRAARVALGHGVVSDGATPPLGRDSGIGRQPKLDHERRHHAEKPGVVIEPGLCNA